MSPVLPHAASVRNLTVTPDEMHVSPVLTPRAAPGGSVQSVSGRTAVLTVASTVPRIGLQTAPAGGGILDCTSCRYLPARYRYLHISYLLPY